MGDDQAVPDEPEVQDAAPQAAGEGDDAADARRCTTEEVDFGEEGDASPSSFPLRDCDSPGGEDEKSVGEKGRQPSNDGENGEAADQEDDLDVSSEDHYWIKIFPLPPRFGYIQIKKMTRDLLKSDAELVTGETHNDYALICMATKETAEKYASLLRGHEATPNNKLDAELYSPAERTEKFGQYQQNKPRFYQELSGQRKEQEEAKGNRSGTKRYVVVKSLPAEAKSYAWFRRFASSLGMKGARVYGHKGGPRWAALEFVDEEAAAAMFKELDGYKVADHPEALQAETANRGAVEKEEKASKSGQDSSVQLRSKSRSRAVHSVQLRSRSRSRAARVSETRTRRDVRDSQRRRSSREDHGSEQAPFVCPRAHRLSHALSFEGDRCRECDRGSKEGDSAFECQRCRWMVCADCVTRDLERCLCWQLRLSKEGFSIRNHFYYSKSRQHRRERGGAAFQPPPGGTVKLALSMSGRYPDDNWLDRDKGWPVAYHGTNADEEKVKSILSKGLLVRGGQSKPRIGERYGEGIYLTPDPKMAATFCDRPVRLSESSRPRYCKSDELFHLVIQCRVRPGSFTITESRLPGWRVPSESDVRACGLLLMPTSLVDCRHKKAWTSCCGKDFITRRQDGTHPRRRSPRSRSRHARSRTPREGTRESTRHQDEPAQGGLRRSTGALADVVFPPREPRDEPAQGGLRRSTGALADVTFPPREPPNSINDSDQLNVPSSAVSPSDVTVPPRSSPRHGGARCKPKPSSAPELLGDHSPDSWQHLESTSDGLENKIWNLLNSVT